MTNLTSEIKTSFLFSTDVKFKATQIELYT